MKSLQPGWATLDRASITGDATYTDIESQIESLTAQRNALCAQMIGLLNGAEFNGQPIGNHQAFILIVQGLVLLKQASDLANAG
jgi:hypothetical protein